MRLKIDDLIIDAFKCFTNGTVELDLGKIGPGLHRVVGINEPEPHLGSNGAGKTSLWDALTWCLYGRTADGLRATDVKPWYGKSGTTSVSAMVRGHEVTRTARPNKLLIDGKERTQDDVDELVGLTYDLWINTVLLGQGQPLFFDLEPKQKMSLLGTVSNSERWDIRSKRAAALVNGYDTELYDISNEIARIGGKLEQTKVAFERLEQEKKYWEQTQTKRARAREQEVARLEELVEKTTRAREQADLALDGALTELRPLQQQLIELATHKQEMDRLAEELLSLGDTCPVCDRPLKGSKLAEHKARLQQQMKQCRARVRELEPLAEAKQKFQRKSDEAQSQLNILNEQLTRYTADLATLKAESAQQESPFTQQWRDLTRDRNRLRDEREDLKQRATVLHRKQTRALFWVKGFKEVRLFELEEILQELELVTNVMLEDAGLPDWRVQYDIEKETQKGTIQRGLIVSILSPQNKKPVRWECWSGGERQRLRLIGALALSDVLLNYANVQPTIEVLDEPTPHLSKEGVEDLVTYLADRADRMGRQVWLISHENRDTALFRSTLTVVKTNRGSHLEH